MNIDKKIMKKSSKDTKKRIMDASILLFLKKGFDNVSLSEIKEASNITSGGFYHYFESKEQLIEEVQVEYIFNHFEKVMLNIKNSSGSLKDKIKLLANYNLKYDPHAGEMKTPDKKSDIALNYYILYLESFRRSEDNRSILKNFNKELFEIYKGIIDDAKEKRELKKDLDSDKLTIFIMSLFNGAIDIGVTVPDLDMVKLYHNNIDILLNNVLE